MSVVGSHKFPRGPQEFKLWNQIIDQADSFIVDFDDWSVGPHIFRQLDLKWGCHPIDRAFWNPYCEAMDSVKRSWDFDSNWVCPPLTLFRGL
ncbi:unnamed protein product [Porites evermanni]|uniref:Uncharacterized protein n=1 Tax=Porites evermanni TaxID=104178 RepID=A0ABN8M4H3_9CNID|nr:unnamed protein product [Porites evermanni]